MQYFLTSRPNAVHQPDPSLVCFDGPTAIPYLGEFPGSGGLHRGAGAFQ